MRDRLFFPLLGLIAAGMVALALVWPQGAGIPSPRPFGHPLRPLAVPAMPLSIPGAASSRASSSATLHPRTPLSAEK